VTVAFRGERPADGVEVTKRNDNIRVSTVLTYGDLQPGRHRFDLAGSLNRYEAFGPFGLSRYGNDSGENGPFEENGSAHPPQMHLHAACSFNSLWILPYRPTLFFLIALTR
jgi:hypothetical protein